jgi:rhodanese-related sulfurtransferase/DNA-binding transcriptional ArsR family regulator
MSGDALKQRLHVEFARIGQALSNESRLTLLDLLAQGPRHVEALALETGMPVANVSQHLQVLRRARLVESERRGTKAHYRLADESVLHLWLALSAAGARLAEVEQIARELPDAGERDEEVARDELGGPLRRPLPEYESGHIRGAMSLPLEDLPQRLEELPRDRVIIAYCRGTYCLSADEAVALLKQKGFTAHRLEGGWPEWRGEGRPVSSSATP